MTNMTYVRWQRGASRRGRIFPTPAPGDDLAAAVCVLCEHPLGSDPGGIQLVAIGPYDEETRLRYDAGRWHTAGAVIVHAAGVAAMSEANLDVLASQLAMPRDVVHTDPTGAHSTAHVFDGEGRPTGWRRCSCGVEAWRDEGPESLHCPRTRTGDPA